MTIRSQVIPTALASDGIDPLDPLDIFNSALSTTFTIEPLTVSLDQSGTFTFRETSVSAPSPAASNWALQADSIWRSGLYLAEHLPSTRGKTVLELGAGTGLVGLMCASEGGAVSVVLSDYPDPDILLTLQRNVDRNNLRDRVEVAGHTWGDEESLQQILSSGHADGFDLVIGSDLLWLSEQHQNIYRTLSRALKQNPASEAYFVAGFHTGRYIIGNFMDEATRYGFKIAAVREVSLTEEGKEQAWDVNREQQVLEKRRWLVIIVLKWCAALMINLQKVHARTSRLL
ncbi:hypothetical protein FRB94_004277 [Tulasnella sp. JGI-2019a]|nr:hypothetical protein FRB93_000278 [Tulasnella sp. JGI-2019a]KAG9015158.1 hypothetical protein FRB94_004277 [Tulasnella sp. JGI-2019a]KAG9039227.1 hypothetical protein FRB95_011812 [Tulasnella sp. JGI-2019a]